MLALSAGSAQEAISGTVSDTTGLIPPGVTVEARSPAAGDQVRSTSTDGAGALKEYSPPASRHAGWPTRVRSSPLQNGR